MLNTRQRAAQPALDQHTPTSITEQVWPKPKDAVLAIDPTARFFHYGPQGTKAGWVKGKGWETPITYTEDKAWENAEMQLRARQGEEPVLTPGGMYPKVVDIEGRTMHSPFCKAAFSRRDWRCSRCCELQLGALPRESGHAEYFRRKLREVQRVLLFPHNPS